MTPFRRLVGAAIFASLILVASAAPALAECDGPILDFRQVVPSASRVFIGDVTAVYNPGPEGFGSRFTLLVRYVLRGRVHRWPMEIRDLKGTPCSPYIEVTKGQRIALALGGTARFGREAATVNSVAHVTGPASPSWVGPDPHLRFDEIYRLAGVQLTTTDVGPPDTSTADPGRDVGATQLSALLSMAFGAGLLGLALAWWRWPSRNAARG